MSLRIEVLGEIVDCDSRDAHRILRLLTHIKQQNEQTMATLLEVQPSLTALEATTAAESKAIADLAARAGQPPAATAADLSALKARIDTVNSGVISDTAKVAAIDQPPTPVQPATTQS